MITSDNDLIQNIRSGDTGLYRHLVDRYKDRAFMLAVKMLHNREDAEEAAQDAFVRAFNALHKFEGSAKFGTWFYKILYNVCLTRIAKRKDEFETLQFDENNSPDSPLTHHEGYSVYETNDTISFIKRTIDSLPTKYRTVLSLFYFQDLSHQEICDVTQMPTGTVKTHLFRARIMLQEKLKKEFALEEVI
jgi:RNA polymerase sigma-70 factor (ECF subfamily)